MTTVRSTRDSAIVATGLRKAFGDHVVLDGIDLDEVNPDTPCRTVSR